ncbi:hypothetical protein XAP412_200021 [Xanthomonas phaseoli pv. phaseoli]|nr:hypothetical protein XAP412_200021 [Xanthomonas phaseoli pv. phaseoli]
MAQAGGCETAARWTRPVAHLLGRRQAASRCRQDSAGTHVRCADDGGRQGVSVSQMLLCIRNNEPRPGRGSLSVHAQVDQLLRQSPGPRAFMILS